MTHAPTTSQSTATAQTATADATQTNSSPPANSTTQTSSGRPASSTTQTSTTSQATSVSQSSSGQSGPYLDPYANQCAPYANAYGSPYAYACPCSPYDPGYEYYADCAPGEGVTVVSKTSVPRPKVASVVAVREHIATSPTLAEPASLPFTGENAVLVALLGAGIASAGALLRRRTQTDR